MRGWTCWAGIPAHSEVCMPPRRGWCDRGHQLPSKLRVQSCVGVIPLRECRVTRSGRGPTWCCAQWCPIIIIRCVCLIHRPPPGPFAPRPTWGCSRTQRHCSPCCTGCVHGRVDRVMLSSLHAVACVRAAPLSRAMEIQTNKPSGETMSRNVLRQKPVGAGEAAVPGSSKTRPVRLVDLDDFASFRKVGLSR